MSEFAGSGSRSQCPVLRYKESRLRYYWSTLAGFKNLIGSSFKRRITIGMLGLEIEGVMGPRRGSLGRRFYWWIGK